MTSLNISNNSLGAKTLGPKKADISASEGDVVVHHGMQGVLGRWNDQHFGFTPLDGVKSLADAITVRLSLRNVKPRQPLTRHTSLVNIIHTGPPIGPHFAGCFAPGPT